MSKRKKPALTRRQKRLYDAILSHNHQTLQGYMWTNWSLYSAPSGYLFGWSALFFARQWQGRNIDLKKLQRVVILSGDPVCAYEFARDIPGANVRKLQQVVVAGMNPKMLRLFMQLPAADKIYLESMLVISEVLGL